MKDYAAMSDQEIGRLVAAASKMDGGGSYSGETLVIRNGVWAAFDPCNNPADAWPIIVKNRISIINLDEDEWGTRGVADRNSKRAIHENPLRAAMVVFLMMKEGEND